MGMFDTVKVDCPVCGVPVEKQTKAGECNLSVYTIHNAPVEVLLGVADSTFRCKNGHPFHIKVQVIKHAEIVKGIAEARDV